MTTDSAHTSEPEKTATDASRVAEKTPVVELRNLVKTFRGESRKSERVRAVNDVSLEISAGEFFTLLGPSGCGKTTTLRSLAGLETPDGGEVVLAGQTVYRSKPAVNVPSNARRIGMVFQSYAIWPHMTVFENVAFPLRVRPRRERPRRQELDELVERAMATVQLDGLGNRPATNLSGGQQQRLALARALVGEPPVMLLDEPLSNLDAKLRDSMRLELKRLQRELGFTAIYVTHDQVEALAMSNRIAVMRHGVIQQIGRPREIYENPANQFVADFIGRSNFLEGSVVAGPDDGVYVVRTAVGDLRATGDAGYVRDQSVVVCVRPESVKLRRPVDGDVSPHAVEGRIEARQFLGECIDYRVSFGDVSFEVRTDPSMSWAPGTAVAAVFPPTYTRILRA